MHPSLSPHPALTWVLEVSSKSLDPDALWVSKTGKGAVWAILQKWINQQWDYEQSPMKSPWLNSKGTPYSSWEQFTCLRVHPGGKTLWGSTAGLGSGCAALCSTAGRASGEGSPAAAETVWWRGSTSCMDPVLASSFLKMMMNGMTNELRYYYNNPPVLSCLLFFSYSLSRLQIHFSNSLTIQTLFL